MWSYLSIPTVCPRETSMIANEIPTHRHGKGHGHGHGQGHGACLMTGGARGSGLRVIGSRSPGPRLSASGLGDKPLQFPTLSTRWAMGWGEEHASGLATAPKPTRRAGRELLPHGWLPYASPSLETAWSRHVSHVALTHLQHSPTPGQRLARCGTVARAQT
jgi:hypothetical protein